MSEGDYEVRVLPFEHTFTCSEGETLLAAAQRQGYFLRYGCKNGGCGTCKIRLVDGDVDQCGAPMALSALEDSRGWVLACISEPCDDCVIDVRSMELTEEEFLAGDQRGEFVGEVVANDRVARDVRRLQLRLVEPATIAFRAGQFVNVEAPGTDEVRAYSLANPPSDEGFVELFVRILPGGVFSGRLDRSIAVGDRIRLYGPFGQLRVHLSHRNILMICGGTGLAPMLSMVAGLAEERCTRPVFLFYGARTRDQLFGLDAVRRVQERMPFTFVQVLSDEDWEGETGFVTDAVARRFESLRGWDAYLCGPPPMITAAIDLLVERGVRKRNIYLDAFLPTGGT